MVLGKHTQLCLQRRKEIVRGAFEISSFELRAQYLRNESPVDFEIKDPLSKLRDWADNIFGGKCCYTHQIDYLVARDVRVFIAKNFRVDIEVLRTFLYSWCHFLKKMDAFNCGIFDEVWAVKFYKRHDLPAWISFATIVVLPPPLPTPPTLSLSPPMTFVSHR
jgi:hypothetical protein